jgi:hypothetical protein
VSWVGNTTAYMTCNLPARGPQYVGTCYTPPVSCVSTNNDTRPYNCTAYDTGLQVPGNLASSR